MKNKSKSESSNPLTVWTSITKKKLPWKKDAPEGKCWKCPNCNSWATLGGNAAFHAITMLHGLPKLVKKPNVNPLNQPVVDLSTAFLGSFPLTHFIPCSSAQPHFDTQVLVLFGGRVLGLAKRTQAINCDINQEIWEGIYLKSEGPITEGITHWKPI